VTATAAAAATIEAMISDSSAEQRSRNIVEDQEYLIFEEDAEEKIQAVHILKNLGEMRFRPTNLRKVQQGQRQ